MNPFRRMYNFNRLIYRVTPRNSQSTRTNRIYGGIENIIPCILNSFANSYMRNKSYCYDKDSVAFFLRMSICISSLHIYGFFSFPHFDRSILEGNYDNCLVCCCLYFNPSLTLSPPLLLHYLRMGLSCQQLINFLPS